MKRIIALAAALMLLAFTALSAAADMLGDVNGNGAIDAADYAMAKRQCLGTYEMTADELLRADINGNGAVDPTEYAMIKRHVLGTYTIEGEVDINDDSPASEGLEYELNESGDGYIVTGIGTCTDNAIVIPAKYKDLPVVEIDYAAFARCTSLESITIPDSVTSINADAFFGCANLESITVDQKNTVYHSAGDCLIETESKTLVAGCKNSIIPTDGSVTSIGHYAFGGCTSLKSITIPNSVTSIGDLAFYGCTSLTSITIPDSVKSIGFGAFRSCTSLTSITIPDSVTSINAGAFFGCANLESITVDQKNTVYHSAGNCLIETKRKWLIAGCKNSVIPTDGSVTHIDNGAFYNCTSLTSITIPDSVTSIGDWAFQSCTGLTSITIPNSVKSIGFGAFRSCTSLTSITIPDSVTSINAGAFFGCANLESITVDKKNTVYHSAGNCLIETKRKWLIAGCKNSIIPTDGSVTHIDDGAFYNCTSLTSITIPDSVTGIGPRTFKACTGLTNITIPGSVTWIGFDAFYGCTSLSTVYYTGTKAQWEAIEIGEKNDALQNATIVFNYKP